MKLLVVVAHPDDETVGAAIKLSRADPAEIKILHITNGSPRDLEDAHANGFQTAQDYEDARRAELNAAMALVGIQPDQCTYLDVVDKESCRNLAYVTARVGALIDDWRPDALLTHAYEGGHPDHDSASFAVSQAAASDNRIPVLEFACYFAGPSGIEAGKFYPGTGEPTEIIILNRDEQRTKRAMLDCFRSQQRVLYGFPLERECFRPAPVYDYTKPPHGGNIHYEKHGWGITGELWRQFAREALRRS